MIELILITIGVAILWSTWAICRCLETIGIALKGIELHSGSLIGSAVRIHQALNRVK